MYRIVVISLFIANLLLVGLEVSKPPVKTDATTRTRVAEDSSIPTIHLLSELMQDQELMSASRQCFTLGPFHDMEDMREVRNRLQEVSLSTADRRTQALVEQGYWVFLRPYRSFLEANEVLLSLQALGLQDIAVIYEGKPSKSISLGYFLRQENAVKRQQWLVARGYEPLIRVRRKYEPRYWLDYEQYPGAGLITLDLQNRPNDFMRRRVPCPQQGQFETTVTAAQPIVLEGATTSEDG